MAEESLTIIDNRTGEQVTLPIVDGAIRATELPAVVSYDPAFLNTAACRSAITYIDGDAGILRYRGYPIDELAETAGFLETAYLLLEGELPTAAQLATWEDQVRYHTYVHESVTKFLEGFRYDAHPMGMLLGAVGALSTFYPDAKEIFDPENRHLQRVRLIAKLPTIAAYIFRHSHGLPYVLPRNDLDYIGNFVNMTFEIGGRHEPNPVLQRALEILLILHADHEQNCSTNAVRGVGSSHVDPFSAVSAGIAALYGPLHGGANEAVLRMLDEIGDKKNIPGFIEAVKAGHGRLMGFGHRVYKSYDPRAKLIKEVADSVFAETGVDPKLEIALELEKIALEDEYFISRRLYPNVDFYSGLIYKAMGYPTDYFTVLFALGRLPGWISQWEEMLTDPEQKIARPRQVYIGAGDAAFRPDRRARVGVRAPSRKARTARRLVTLLAVSALVLVDRRSRRGQGHAADRDPAGVGAACSCAVDDHGPNRPRAARIPPRARDPRPGRELRWLVPRHPGRIGRLPHQHRLPPRRLVAVPDLRSGAGRLVVRCTARRRLTRSIQADPRRREVIKANRMGRPAVSALHRKE